MKNEKKVMLLSLTILAVLLTGFTWAYWNSGKIEATDVKAESNTIQIGTGEKEDVQTSIRTWNDDQKVYESLVPSSIDSNRSKVELEYLVAWETTAETLSGAVGKVVVSQPKISIKDEKDNPEINDILKSLFTTNISIKETSIGKDLLSIGGSTYVVVTVDFEKEPLTKEDYLAIAGKDLVVEFTVQIVPVD